MLVLSRGENEGILLGRSRLVTVARVLQNAVGILVRDFDGTDKPILLSVNESVDVGLGVRITLVSTGETRARLGIEAPKELPVARKEVSDIANEP